MKKIIIAFFILIAIVGVTGSIYCFFTSFKSPSNNRISGNGEIITRMVDLPPFDKATVSQGITLLFVADDTQQATIEADDNIMEYVFVRVEDGELEVGIDAHPWYISNIDVKVTIPTNGVLRKLEANSAAKIQSGLTLTGESLDMDASSAGEIDIKAVVTRCSIDVSSAATLTAEINATDFESEASSAATIQLRGHVVNGKVDLSSAATFDGEEFIMTNGRVKASSAANASVHCTGTLSAYASSGASISYTGNAIVDHHPTRGGSIRKY